VQCHRMEEPTVLTTIPLPPPANVHHTRMGGRYEDASASNRIFLAADKQQKQLYTAQLNSNGFKGYVRNSSKVLYEFTCKPVNATMVCAFLVKSGYVFALFPQTLVVWRCALAGLRCHKDCPFQGQARFMIKLQSPGSAGIMHKLY